MSELAQGGPVEPGMPYIVGTGGPELFIPDSSGVVIPNDALSALADPDVEDE